MKQILLSLVAAMAVLVCCAATPSKTYYVVSGSYSSLASAQAANDNDAPIYDFSIGAKKVFRVCPACFYNKADAQEYVRGYKQAFKTDAWVATCDGEAMCVTDISNPMLIPYKHVSPSTMVYYIVGGSFSSLVEAQRYNTTCPDGLEGTIVECTVKGKKMYRVVVGCYARKATAQEQVGMINSLYGNDFWVWSSKGMARVATYGVSLAGHLIWLTPQ